MCGAQRIVTNGRIINKGVHMKQKTKAQLQQSVIDLGAQLAYRYKAASLEIDKAGEALFASAAVLRITALGGLELVAPVAIRDGLSKETIEAIRRDLQRSYDGAIGKRP